MWGTWLAACRYCHGAILQLYAASTTSENEATVPGRGWLCFHHQLANYTIPSMLFLSYRWYMNFFICAWEANFCVPNFLSHKLHLPKCATTIISYNITLELRRGYYVCKVNWLLVMYRVSRSHKWACNLGCFLLYEDKSLRDWVSRCMLYQPLDQPLMLYLPYSSSIVL